ncbi:MAG: hypothetical protein E7G15_07425 [Cutibacterium avidum]|nr:hypothetical protein [Cutibacterium avidum]MDU5300066.1 hypothetical protein [Cutibacterium avidum]MDU5867445.1 hypothetical protein [Cutibacterium avidum]MDU8016185.1 hypothetical protein [Cutibacterium avidum]
MNQTWTITVTMADVAAIAVAFKREHIRQACEILRHCEPEYWERRAHEYEDVIRPRPGESRRQGTDQDRAERRARCLADARNCRRHAELLRGIGISDELTAVLADVLQASWDMARVLPEPARAEGVAA